MHTLFQKRKVLLYLGIPLLLGVISFIFFAFDKDEKVFQKETALIFYEEMTSNIINMHYTLATPENYGITEYTPALPCYSSKDRQESRNTLTAHINTLSKISSDSFSYEDKYTYNLLLSYLRNTLVGYDYIYYEDPLSPSSGMQSQLPILLAEYTFRTKRDVEDYLSILDQTDEYFSSLILFEKEKKDAGLLQADTSLQKVINQCSVILSKDSLNAGEHFLQSTFSERLITLISSGILTEEEATKYSAENNRLLTTVMQPAYEKLADDLFLLMGDGTSMPHGLASLPNGQEYYAYLVKTITGSSHSIDEIKDILYASFESEYASLHSLLNSHSDSIETWNLYMDPSYFVYSNGTDMIADLKSRMTNNFPSFPTSGIPPLTLKTVNANLQEYCAPAFYLTPPLDDSNSNVIYINEKNAPSGLELYTTLAHEGYPGHLYQSVYSNEYMKKQTLNPVRQILWYGGYSEGWALYVELISYDYAKELAQENNQPDAAYAYEIEKHNRNLQLCLYSLLDISIHYDNSSFEQIQQVLQSFGISSPEDARMVYDYIAEEPANYLKYYLGYLEILRLQTDVKELWQDNYSDLRFHQFLLERGPSDFASLQEAIAASSVLP